MRDRWLGKAVGAVAIVALLAVRAGALVLHSADVDADNAVNLSEVLRVIQLYNAAGYHCDASTEDGYAPGPGDTACVPHDTDYLQQDWILSMAELLRAIQIHNLGGYHVGPGEDGFEACLPESLPLDTAGLRPVFAECDPVYVRRLYPQGTTSGNVIQGIAVDPARNEIFVSQDMDSDSGNDIQINRLSMATGQPTGIAFYLEASGHELGHGQDLSFEWNRDGSFFLWTSHHGSGLGRADFSTYETATIPDLFCDTWASMTPSTSLDGNFFVARVSHKSATPGVDCLDEDAAVGAQRIHVFLLRDVAAALNAGNPPPVPLYSFTLAPEQMTSGLSFQGIAMDDVGIVYCLTGDTDAYDDNGDPKPKAIYAYGVHGEVLGKVSIDIDRALALTTGSAGEYEPEGLSLVRDAATGAKSLYFTLMFGNPGNRVKRLYVFQDCPG